MDKKQLTERDICTKYIIPALEQSGWDIQNQVQEEVSFTDGKIYVRGTLTSRGNRKRADYILSYKHSIRIAIIEVKNNTLSIGAGIQQALEYAKILDIPFVFSTNGDGFLFHDRTQSNEDIETEITLDQFPSPQELWDKYTKYKGIITPEAHKIITQDYHFDGTSRTPRYYQQNAINRTVEAIAKGQNRILLVMATGTGKTYTAFQIIYRLWKSRTKNRILFLADRRSLIDQTRKGDFKHFKDKMTVIQKKQIDKSYEIYLTLYQSVSGSDEDSNVYKQFSQDFFDLIIIDECHRGSAKEDSSWREILSYFKNATQIGLTATPKETNETSNIEYFGEPIYTYSLKQGIDDGFLAPYRVIRVGLNIAMDGWRPELGKTDIHGNEVEDRIYNNKDFDRNLVIEERTELVAKKITEFLKGYDQFAKTIIFCMDIEHAERMRSALVKQNANLVTENSKYIMQITGDNEEGKRELDNFINPEAKYPVIAVTSELMTTGVDAQTCKVIVLDTNIGSMTKFKQIIGRGTRINEEFGKLYFTILDFRQATDLFADKNFDGEAIRVKEVSQDDDLSNVITEEEENTSSILDELTNEEIVFDPNSNRSLSPSLFTDNNIPIKREKTYVKGVDVSVLVDYEISFNQDGKRITTNLKDYTKEILTKNFSSLHDFLNKWNTTDRKEAIITELQNQGLMVEDLYKAVNQEVDVFDLICHIAFDQPPLTRKERADLVKKRNYFTKYGDQVRKVLEALLDKYADEGITNIETMEVLRLHPFDEFGSPLEIIKYFGSKDKYIEAIKDLETELYKIA